MFDHVTLRVSERGASERFYRRVLATLGIEMSYSVADLVEWSEFSLVEAGDGEGVTRRLHVGFIAPSRAHVDAFWPTGIEAGSRDDGAPGSRAEYGNDYYGGFLLDAEGNSVEAVRRPSTCTWRSERRTGARSARSIVRSWRPVIRTTARRGSARGTTRATTPPTCSIPTATTSRSFVMSGTVDGSNGRGGVAPVVSPRETYSVSGRDSDCRVLA